MDNLKELQTRVEELIECDDYSDDDKRSEFQKEAHKLERCIKLTEQVQRMKIELDDLEIRKAENELLIEEKDEDIKMKQKKLDEKDVEIEKLRKEVEAKEEEINKTRAEVEERCQPWFKKLDIGTVITSGVALVSTVLVLNYERLHVITSRAFRLPK
ncbi:MAG: hypothetical protein HUJ78_02900 [Mogibacterium sp.]|nr:hypothetical protein [Mogibacterium sp.]MCF0239801.1 hypothetical protein [Streptococcus gallolyticus]